jgi:hypothetical protein
VLPIEIVQLIFILLIRLHGCGASGLSGGVKTRLACAMGASDAG